VIALTDVNIEAAGEATTLSLVELVDVEEDGDGWSIGTFYLPNYSRADGEGSIYFNEMRINGITIEAEGEQNAFGGTFFYDSAQVGELVVTVKGADVFTMQDAHIEIELPDDGEPMRFTGAAESFTANLGAADDPQTRAVAAAMGYSEIAGYFEIEGDWDPASGLASMSRFDITVEDAGTIGISLEIGGYTPDFITSLRETQARLSANPGGDSTATGLAMMGLMQQLSLHSARIHFYDDQLTGKVLEFTAQQQGSRARDVANQAKAMVPFMMMQVGNPELTAMATKAATEFLDNPGNLVVAANPPAPVPFALIMAGAMAAPQMLPQQLGVTITANE
jgi:hypothetical protein